MPVVQFFFTSNVCIDLHVHVRFFDVTIIILCTSPYIHCITAIKAKKKTVDNMLKHLSNGYESLTEIHGFQPIHDCICTCTCTCTLYIVIYAPMYMYIYACICMYMYMYMYVYVLCIMCLVCNQLHGSLLTN